MTDERLAQIRELAHEKAHECFMAFVDEHFRNVTDRKVVTRIPAEKSDTDLWLGDYLRTVAAAIPELLTLLDVQKKRIAQLECSVLSPTGEAALLREAALKEKLRADDAEARASRAEQALKTTQDLLAITLADHEAESKGRIAAECSLSTERERVIQECARAMCYGCRFNVPFDADPVRVANGRILHASASGAMYECQANPIRALSSLPTPPAPTIDEQFAGMATDEQYQAEALLLAGERSEVARPTTEGPDSK